KLGPFLFKTPVNSAHILRRNDGELIPTMFKNLTKNSPNMCRVAVLLCFIGIVTAHAAPWVNVGPLNVARHSHTATLLTDGKVLVAGGVGRFVGITDSAELYDPATGSNQPTGSLNILRRNHTA